MKFYGRESELELLEASRARSSKTSQMTVLIGRRRVGKTRLVIQSLKGIKFLYFFVSKKTERLLCQDFNKELERVYGEPIIGEVGEFQLLFQYVCRLAKREQVHLFIDEFQEFASINPSVFSDLQRDWDLNKNEMNLNLVLGGSIQSMMNTIFLNAREPLFGRATSIIRVAPFKLSTIRRIILDHLPSVNKADLLAVYNLTGGVAQYIEYLVEREAFTQSDILKTVFTTQSPFLAEGGTLLVQDLGKDYSVYFSILSLVASGFTSRPKIESVLQKPIGGYLTRLEKIYGIITRKRPIFSKENSTDIQFYITDNFLKFWFRFVHKNQSMLEANNLEAALAITTRDYRTYAGMILEDYIRAQLVESQNFTKIGNYWERGNQNEIDIVAINELNQTAIIGEVKWQRKRVNLAKLELKAQKLIKQNLKGYQVTYKAFGLEDIKI